MIGFVDVRNADDTHDQARLVAINAWATKLLRLLDENYVRHVHPSHGADITQSKPRRD